MQNIQRWAAQAAVVKWGMNGLIQAAFLTLRDKVLFHICFNFAVSDVYDLDVKNHKIPIISYWWHAECHSSLYNVFLSFFLLTQILFLFLSNFTSSIITLSPSSHLPSVSHKFHFVPLVICSGSQPLLAPCCHFSLSASLLHQALFHGCPGGILNIQFIHKDCSF